MKRLLTLFTLSLVLVACDTQPVGVETPDAQFAKGEKPGKPPKPASGELITFTGNLIGSMEVAGCCPNAGPFPAYTMTLAGPPFPAGPDEIIAGTWDGHIFMHHWAQKGNRERGYIVQFWWGEETENYYFMEIKGGDVQSDKRTKFLTATFTDEEMTIWNGVEFLPAVSVSFVLTRDPIGYLM